jgi:AraC-like DNA-binding protein
LSAFLDKIQLTFPDPSLKRSKIHVYRSAVVVETRALPPSDCVCGQFLFLMPFCPMPDIVIGRNRISMPLCSVLPCNPLQHFYTKNPEIPDFRAAVIYISNELLLDTAQSLYGSRSLAFRETAFSCSPRLKTYMMAFIEECQMHTLGCDLMLETYAQQMAITILRESQHSHGDALLPSRDYRDKASVLKAVEYLYDNYLNKITLSDLAKEINYSPYHFLRLFQKHTGKSPAAFLLDIKLEKARRMLEDTRFSVSQVSDLCGFGSLSHFSNTFAKHMGLTPTEYKAQHR